MSLLTPSFFASNIYLRQKLQILVIWYRRESRAPRSLEALKLTVNYSWQPLKYFVFLFFLPLPSSFSELQHGQTDQMPSDPDDFPNTPSSPSTVAGSDCKELGYLDYFHLRCQRCPQHFTYFPKETKGGISDTLNCGNGWKCGEEERYGG